MEPPVNRGVSLPLKLLVVFCLGALLSFGLCTASAFGVRGGSDHFALIGASGFFLCTAGVVASFIWWIVTKASR